MATAETARLAPELRYRFETMISLAVMLIAAVGAAADAGTAAMTQPTPAMTQPAEIDQACDPAEKYANAHEARGRLVGDVSDAVQPKKGEGVWKVFRRAKDLDDASEDGAPNTQARVWIRPGGIMYVEATFQSASGDWVQYVDYCYRPDGSLARTKLTYNTFLSDVEGGVSGLRTRHYDPSGQVLDSKQKVLSLETKKRVPKSKFPDDEEPVFFKRDELPFWERVKDLVAGAGPAAGSNH
jgi:hypothetical protein